MNRINLTQEERNFLAYSIITAAEENFFNVPDDMILEKHSVEDLVRKLNPTGMVELLDDLNCIM